MAVGRFHPFGSGYGADQHKQRRFGQVKVGYQHVNHFEFVAGGNENSGFSHKGVQNALIVRGAFQQSQRGRAYRNYTAAAFFGPVDLFDGVRRNDAVFGMHFVVLGIFRFNGQKSSRTNVEGQIGFFNAFVPQPVKNFRGKMQSGGRSGDGSFVFGVDGLIVFFVVEFMPDFVFSGAAFFSFEKIFFNIFIIFYKNS